MRAQQQPSGGWRSDCVECPPPTYPFGARLRHAQGDGLFRLTLDAKTGVVIKATTLKTTGSGLLDKTAIAALKRWRFKPGKSNQIDVPVDFKIVPRGMRTPASN